MTIFKREISLSEVLGTYLCYTPGTAETDEFRADLRTLNHTLLRDSIQECHQAEKEKDTANAGSKRHLIHQAYTRKVKELAALYPFLFATENALRAIASESYSQLFKDAYWWRDILSAVKAGQTEAHFLAKGDGKKRVRNIPVNSAFVSACFFATTKFSVKQMRTLEDAECPSTKFYDEMTIRHLFNLIDADLSLCPIGNLQRQQFKNHMMIICDARNEVFHGNPIKNRSSLFTACEIVLDAACFHLGDFDEALRNATYTRQTPSKRRNAKHLLPPRPIVKAAQ
ncbi:hypothetical protein [Loktanella sp. M215]|uniref:hypothetical protein n=1 Tax=Loktanella sp. M215 TaxID=2675431 RepID=UPI001F34725F|nr:hypothetical protein [Loktanella sp. M215]MCF7699951.1 hypothetical protein [Loktanella sp. M215]